MMKVNRKKGEKLELEPDKKIELCDLIQEREVIWKSTENEYVDRVKKDVAFKQIADISGVCFQDVKKSYSSQRTNLSRASKKKNKSMSENEKSIPFLS